MFAVGHAQHALAALSDVGLFAQPFVGLGAENEVLGTETLVPGLGSVGKGGGWMHSWLEDGRSLYDMFNFEWALLVLGEDAPDASAFERAAQQMELDLKVVRHASQQLRDLYEAPLVLIRPDQIVAWRGHDSGTASEVLAQVSANG